jgi:maltose O-acetyltransferase
VNRLEREGRPSYILTEFLDATAFFTSHVQGSLNFNCVVLDVAHVTIGDRTLFGPAVQLYAATTHLLSLEKRRSGLELGRPVDIGSDVWIGGSAIICPGVTIGEGAVIGAGSVVTRDIPAGVFAAGNPCRVIRSL